MLDHAFLPSATWWSHSAEGCRQKTGVYAWMKSGSEYHVSVEIPGQEAKWAADTVHQACVLERNRSDTQAVLRAYACYSNVSTRAVWSSRAGLWDNFNPQ
jgi:hypothetical protein